MCCGSDDPQLPVQERAPIDCRIPTIRANDTTVPQGMLLRVEHSAALFFRALPKSQLVNVERWVVR